MTNLRDRLRRQIELEDESRALGKGRYHSRKLPWKVEAGSPDEEANLPPGQQLLKVCIEPVTERIREYLKEVCSGKAGRRHNAADFLLLTEPDEIAYLATRVMVNMSMARALVQTVSIKVADAIIENLEFTAFREQNRDGYKGYMKKQEARGYSRQRRAAVKKLFAAEGVAIEMSQSQRATIGLVCVEMVIEATGLFVLDKQPRSKGHANVVAPSEALQAWMDGQHERCSILEPINLPMVVRPRRWRSPTYGGYLTARHGNRFVKQRNRPYHEELRSMDIDRVYASVNHIQDTPWRINRRVLEVMETVWGEGGSLGGLPQRHDDPIPTKPEDIDMNEEARLAWKRTASSTHARNAERISARMSMQQGLWVGRRFADEDAIYFPHELDFRGRVYPIPVYGPSPQGSDWQKAMLEFADGVPLGEEGRRWLMVHLANLFGVDKVSFEDRIQWTLENARSIIDSAMRPLDGERFWATADSPYSALAACFEFAGMLDEGVDYVSHLPVALDGSCSGLQHFSAMLRDERGGAEVNLCPSEEPRDVYGAVARDAQERADAVETITYTTGKGDEEETHIIPNPWRGGKITRTIAKRPTMTFCYSATRFGMQAMILQTLRELDRDAEENGLPPYLGGADNYHSALWLSYELYSSIGRTVSAAATAMDWLRSVARLASTEGLPLWWTTPMGLPILQEYKKQKGHRIDTHWGGQRFRMVVKVEQETLDSRAQANGVAPNFVHSLDAAHLQAVALRGREEGIGHLAVIHDSFGTHAAHTGRLSSILRETFVEQYEGDVLGGFYEELKAQLGDELAEQLPEPPKAGSLDLSVILDASYTFA